MMEYIKSNQSSDHIVNPAYPADKSANLWIEQKKCDIM